MLKKIRELKAMLRKVGFLYRPGKGSHTVWKHPLLDDEFAISGGDGDDAKEYQERKVRDMLKRLKELQK